MPTLAWLTDIHLEHTDAGGPFALCSEVLDAEPDAVLLGGDIGTASTLGGFLGTIERALARPIYFVLGNHDYYGGSITAVRSAVAELARGSEWLHWLPDAGVVALSPTCALVGQGGWGDGRLGSGARTAVEIADAHMIAEMKGLETPDRFEVLARLGDEAAAGLHESLRVATRSFERVIVLTHVPPFQDACWHEGRLSGDDFLPHFACGAVGDVLVEAAEANPAVRFLVLCGHTHSAGEAWIRPNLEARTGGATYGRPRVQGLIAVEA